MSEQRAGSERERLAVMLEHEFLETLIGLAGGAITRKGTYASDLRRAAALLRSEGQTVAYTIRQVTPEGFDLGLGWAWAPMHPDMERDHDRMRANGWTVEVRPLIYADTDTDTDTREQREER